MSDLLKNIDARTKLAGTNKLEILLFTLGQDERTGRRENFAINVFKVREVMRTPEITKAPDMPPSIEGMVSLRGTLVPVIDLARYAGISTSTRPEIMIVSEYNGHTQGFLVEAVDTILRLDWSQMRVPPDMLMSQMGGLVVAVTELENNKLVMMMDVEKVLAESIPGSDRIDPDTIIQDKSLTTKTVFLADDSVVARRQIEMTLDAMKIKHISTINGKRAWDELQRIAQSADLQGKVVKDMVQLVLTDVEMPEMDGYMLTKLIKSDPRFAGIPVLMHSSLSGASNQKLGQSVGVDGYVAKFEPHRLSEAIANFLLSE
ncbi:MULTISPECIES: chemotaxis protein [Iodobacter]|uniref:Chemotaxis protein CheV n=2 Tax=Iodobacter TaxID=32014 RepID=A0A377Q6L3_9NEIS|nr:MULTISPECIES: chemotaxis protein [Iodobacter]NHQ86600.1 chemotaxis protein CheV [Iodobacter violacea]TCU87043.1 two-component system chemotaxis response regulator CheV [Iodobacter fluviatilis]STQ90375.1 Chemotaxis protein CheV [Iodobacter fluviatilis]